MRKDIQKVVFERAKAGRTWASKTPRVKPVVLDASGEQFDESTNMIRQKRQKYRNRHFNPVERFLVRNVGRSWSKDYAEICASADGRSFLSAEVRNFIQDFVATKCWIEGRRVMSVCCGRPQEVRGLYVHPRSGLLRRVRPGAE